MTSPYAWRFAAVVLLSTCALQAKAAITCTVSSSGFTTVYSETITTANDSQGTFTVSCTRSQPAADPTTFVYALRANNGLNQSSGGLNQATNGTGNANSISYELYLDSTYATAWGSRGRNDFDGVVNFGNTSTTYATDTKTFYARVFPQQNVNAKTFTDSVTLSLRNSNGNTVDTSPLGVTIINTASCQFTSPPGTITLNYTSFQAAASTANTPYAVRCTNGTSFLLSLDAIPPPAVTTVSGTAGGLNLPYSLTLSSGSGSITGTGVPQSYSINGSIAAGQSGTCATGSCNASEPHTLYLGF